MRYIKANKLLWLQERIYHLLDADIYDYFRCYDLPNSTILFEFVEEDMKCSLEELERNIGLSVRMDEELSKEYDSCSSYIIDVHLIDKLEYTDIRKKEHDLIDLSQLYLNKVCEALWKELEDVPFDEDEDKSLYLAEDWRGFEKGTYRDAIWKWFDERYSSGVAGLIGL